VKGERPLTLGRAIAGVSWVVLAGVLGAIGATQAHALFSQGAPPVRIEAQP
jgi:uncharacterized membrane protein